MTSNWYNTTPCDLNVISKMICIFLKDLFRFSHINALQRRPTKRLSFYGITPYDLPKKIKNCLYRKKKV